MMIEERQADLEAFHQLYFGESRPEPPRPVPTPPAPVDLREDQRFAAAMRNDGFARLHRGDISGYASQSEARLGYLNRAAFYTGCDETLMDTWFRTSGLDQSKWDSRRGNETLGARDIAKAIADCHQTYTGSNPNTLAEHRIEPSAPTNENGNGHEPKVDDPDVVCMPQAKYERMVAALDEKDTTISRLHARVRTLELTLSNQAAMFASKGLKPGPKLTLARLANELSFRESTGAPTPIKVNCGTLGESVGRTRQAVSRDLDLFAERGIIPKKILGREEHPEHGWLTYTYLTPPEGGAPALLRAAAELDEDPRKQGGYRERRPCPDHPEAALVARQTVCCSVCGQIVEQSEQVLKLQTITSAPGQPHPPSVVLVSSTSQLVTSGPGIARAKPPDTNTHAPPADAGFDLAPGERPSDSGLLVDFLYRWAQLGYKPIRMNGGYLSGKQGADRLATDSRFLAYLPDAFKQVEQLEQQRGGPPS